MGIFRRTRRVNVEEYCHEYYEHNILNPVITGVELGTTYFDKARRSIAEADQEFSNISSEQFASEMIPLYFELFALSWMHRFVGKYSVAQSVFTKRYLQEKGEDDIWNGMKHYNNSVCSATLHWLTGLGKMNLAFWHGVRKDLTLKNVEDAKKMGLPIDEVVERASNRLCSESAWKQGMVVDALVFAVCNELGLSQVRRQAVVCLATVIRGVYDGAYKSLKSIRIKNS